MFVFATEQFVLPQSTFVPGRAKQLKPDGTVGTVFGLGFPQRESVRRAPPLSFPTFAEFGTAAEKARQFPVRYFLSFTLVLISVGRRC